MRRPVGGRGPARHGATGADFYAAGTSGCSGRRAGGRCGSVRASTSGCGRRAQLLPYADGHVGPLGPGRAIRTRGAWTRPSMWRVRRRDGAGRGLRAAGRPGIERRPRGRSGPAAAGQVPGVEVAIPAGVQRPDGLRAPTGASRTMPSPTWPSATCSCGPPGHALRRISIGAWTDDSADSDALAGGPRGAGSDGSRHRGGCQAPRLAGIVRRRDRGRARTRTRRRLGAATVSGTKSEALLRHCLARRGLGEGLRAQVRRGRGALGQRRPAARLRLRAPSHLDGTPERRPGAVRRGHAHVVRARDPFARRPAASRARRGSSTRSTPATRCRARPPAAWCGQRERCNVEARSVRQKLKHRASPRSQPRRRDRGRAGARGRPGGAHSAFVDRRGRPTAELGLPGLIQPEIQVPSLPGDRSSRGDRRVVRDRRRGAAHRGTVRPAGNKNAALPLLAAACSRPSRSCSSNMPRIRDVETMLELLADLGAEVEWTARNEVRVCAAEVHTTSLDGTLSTRIRASILLAGPLLARFGRADVPLPGGDVIGRRRVDTHLMALAALGAEVDGRPQLPVPRAGRAARAPRSTWTRRRSPAPRTRSWRPRWREGTTTIHQCRLRAPRAGPVPPADRDGRARSTASARTSCASTASVSLRRLRTPVGPDHIEVGSFIGLAAVTGGDVTIEDAASPATCARCCTRSRASASRRDRRARRARAARARSSRSSTTCTTRSRRSTTARGRCSRPT